MRVEIDDARIAFGSTVVLSGLTATVVPFAVTALVGPSGSGKSSLLGAMCGWSRLDSGVIRFVDEAGRAHAPSPGLVTWMPQGSSTLSRRTARDNVAIALLAEGVPLGEAMGRADEALDLVGLKRRADEQVGLLSGGERQRVAFARAMVSSRPVVLADEPTASLDAAATRNIAELFHAVRIERTIVIASHDPAVIAAADHVIELRPTGGTHG